MKRKQHIPAEIIAAPVIASLLVESLLRFMLKSGRLTPSEVGEIVAIGLTELEIQTAAGLDPKLRAIAFDALLKLARDLGLSPVTH